MFALGYQNGMYMQLLLMLVAALGNALIEASKDVMLPRSSFSNQFCFQMGLGQEYICDRGNASDFERSRFSEIYPLIGVSWNGCCNWMPHETRFRRQRLQISPVVADSELAHRLTHWIFGSMTAQLKQFAVPLHLHEFDKLGKRGSLRIFVYDLPREFHHDRLREYLQLLKKAGASCGLPTEPCAETSWSNSASSDIPGERPNGGGVQESMQCAASIPLLLKFLSWGNLTTDPSSANILLVPSLKKNEISCFEY